MTVNRIAGWVSALAATVAVIAGLVIAGSPQQQRLERYDGMRIDHLRMLTGAIDRRWKEQGTLPPDLVTLVDGRRLPRLPVDPATAEPYRYEALDTSATSARYRLCTTFDLPSKPTPALEFWSHPAGEHCYEFEVTREPGRNP